MMMPARLCCCWAASLPVSAELASSSRAGRLVVRLGDDGVDPVVEQPVAGLLQQEPPDDADHGGGEHRARHDPRLDRASPEGQAAAQGVRQPAGSRRGSEVDHGVGPT